MVKSTAAVIIILVIFAALLVFVNLFGFKNKPSSTKVTQQSTNKPAPTLITYRDAACGIELTYPDSLNILEGPTSTVIFTGKTNTSEVIIVTCQKNIPRPAIAADKIEQLKSGSVSASLYHDTSAKDGTPIDKLIFTNPNNDLDIFISGNGPDFQQIIGNIQLIQ